MEVSSSDEGNSVPLIPQDSPGSSVSSRLQDEYDELLRYAVVMPTYKPQELPKSLADLRGSFPAVQHELISHEEEEDTSTEIGEGEDGTLTRESTGIHGESVQPPRVVSGGNPKSRTSHVVFDENKDDRPASPISSIHSESLPPDMIAYSVTVDTDVKQMEMLLDQWSVELKKKVLAEVSQSKLHMLELQRQNAYKEKQRYAAEFANQQNETETLRELLHTYETSIERKDQVIANLTQAMQHQRDRYEMLKTFCDWRLRLNDQKREAFASNLARSHYERTLAQKSWAAWHSLVEDKWRHRVEKACQAKAQEVCIELTNDYEAKLTSANEALAAARVEVARLSSERERYEEAMKKAFMRGVCALNMEAMAMFHEANDGNPESQDKQEVSGGQPLVTNLDTVPTSTTIPQEAVFSSAPPGAPMPRVVTSLGTSLTTSSITTSTGRTGAGVRGKTISARVTARTDTGRGSTGATTLAPPMSSVLVERHQPVTKQTIGHATASRYPRGSGQQAQPAIVQRKIAGQFPPSAPNVQTVKVVD